MTDRELLERAAKAAGLVHLTQWSDHISDYDSDHYGLPALHAEGTAGECNSWNPLEDDGDALRLAVKLGQRGYLRIDIGYGAVSVDDPVTKPLPTLLACEDMEELGGAAATRRAIVRAAAAMSEDV